MDNATITVTFLGLEHGRLTATIIVEGKSWGQAFGGYDLNRFADTWILGILQCAEVDSWEGLVGRHIRIAREHGVIVSIAHIVDDAITFDAREWQKSTERHAYVGDP